MPHHSPSTSALGVSGRLEFEARGTQRQRRPDSADQKSVEVQGMNVDPASSNPASFTEPEAPASALDMELQAQEAAAEQSDGKGGGSQGVPEEAHQAHPPPSTPEQRIQWRRQGEDFTYQFQVEEADPLLVRMQHSIGLSFAAAGPPPQVVSEVRPGSVAESQGAAVGDLLLAVNDVNLTSAATAAALRAISLATWPRTFLFRSPTPREATQGAPGTVARDGSRSSDNRQSNAPRAQTRDLVLRIASPLAIAGEFPIKLATWGSEWQPSSCSPVPLGVFDPPTGCGTSVLVRWGSSTQLHKSSDQGIVLATRGVCAFTDKAKALDSANEALSSSDAKGGLVLVVNTEDSTIDMPAGRGIGGLEAAAASISSSHGSMLLQALAWATRSNPGENFGPLEAWIGPPEECRGPSEAVLPPPLPAPSQPAGSEGGHAFLLLASGTASGPDEYRVAAFGRPGGFGTAPLKAVLAHPREACSSALFKVRVKGMVAIVYRGGGCSFFDKAMAAQEAGATGVIIVNTEESVLTMPAGPTDATVSLRIPAAMVPLSFGETAAAAAQGTPTGRSEEEAAATRGGGNRRTRTRTHRVGRGGAGSTSDTATGSSFTIVRFKPATSH
mmetsp:Transcript_12526/g.36309  ORF Transcript_12526/g.36309 Transcript_12526/m.36309 type:complete len:613 (-) Transcript_12526:127-1965(-)